LDGLKLTIRNSACFVSSPSTGEDEEGVRVQIIDPLILAFSRKGEKEHTAEQLAEDRRS
jgi:hypothetical protein